MKKAVLITGASGGTGFAIAGKFAKEGYAVFISSRRENAAEVAAEKISNRYDWINVNKVDRKKRKNHVIINNASF